MTEKYVFDIPEEGSNALEVLDYCFNQSTQTFLNTAGLSSGMTVLEIGCGSGKMSCSIARVIGETGKLIAIDNNQSQLDAARTYAENNRISNIKFECLDAYNITELNISFDFVYCRFVLHHLLRPRAVIASVYQCLNSNGTVAAEEGVVNNGFAYPYTVAFGTERFDLLDHHENLEGKQRDPNFGIKLYHCLYQQGFKALTVKIVAPTLSTRTEKSLLIPGMQEYKKTFISDGHSQSEWLTRMQELQQMIDDDSAMIAFFQSVQVSGKV